MFGSELFDYIKSYVKMVQATQVLSTLKVAMLRAVYKIKKDKKGVLF